MIARLTNADRAVRAGIFDEMFRARALVFRDRLGWNVKVRDGWEIDRYDEEEDPVYLVSLDEGGGHVGSLRLLPTTGETMLRNEFAHFFTEPVDVEGPTLWECTRFCVWPGPTASREVCSRASADLLIGLCELCLDSGIDQIIGVYDQCMTRIYARIGWSPAPLAVSRADIGKLMVGIWDVTTDALQTMKRRMDWRAAPEPEPARSLAV